MARDQEMRARVVRLLDGDFRHGDLSTLYLWLRARSHGLASVREIGDFVAHSDDRDKGLVTDEMRDFFGYLSMRFADPADPKKLPDLTDLPARFPDIMKSGLRDLTPQRMKERTGLSRKQFDRVFQSAMRKFQATSDGSRYFKFRALSLVETDVINAVLSHWMPSPLFTGDSVFADFAKALEKNKLLAQSENASLKAIKPGVVLFAVAAMHQTNIFIQDARISFLSAGVRVTDEQLYVSATATWEFKDDKFGVATVPVLDTDLKRADWCDPGIPLNARGEIDCPVEVTPAIKLAPL